MFGGDQKTSGPIANLFDSTLGRMDSWFGELPGMSKPKPKPAASLLTAPETPKPYDTPGRHKSLLGA